MILYHLGIGAGVAPTDPNELEYCYEGNLKVLPSFGVVPVFETLMGLVGVPGMDVNPLMILHAEQDLEIHKPIPTRGSVSHTARVAEIWDRQEGATVVVEATSTDDKGEALFTNRFSAFIRGEGGFGGERGPRSRALRPKRDADRVVESPTLPQQAFLYRLSGDRNPLHADPEVAVLAGFEKPILHGLCTYGIVCKSVVDGVLGGDVTKVARYRARFSGVLFPGETIVTSMWVEDDQVVVRAASKERQSNAVSASMNVRS